MNKLIQNNPENCFTRYSANQGQSIRNDSLCNNESKKTYNFFIFFIYNLENLFKYFLNKNELINI